MATFNANEKREENIFHSTNRWRKYNTDIMNHKLSTIKIHLHYKLRYRSVQFWFYARRLQSPKDLESQEWDMFFSNIERKDKKCKQFVHVLQSHFGSFYSNLFAGAPGVRKSTMDRLWKGEFGHRMWKGIENCTSHVSYYQITE